MRHRYALLTVFMAVALAVAGCGGDDNAATTTAAPTTTTAATPFRIAIVAPSAQNDLAFTQSMVDAVNLIKGEMGNVEIAISDNQFVVEDAGAAIRDYADQGYDLVIAHGSQYGASVEEIAPDFPDVSFAWGTAADTFGLDNVFSYEAASDEGGYVMGVMAAALSESGVIGVVGPVEVGDAKLYVDGFNNGVLAENPDADVKIVYTGSFSDVALASETAQSDISAGADVLTGSAQMVVGAVGVAADNNVLWFGTQANQTQLAPDIVVASQVYHWEVALRDIISQIQQGTMGGTIYTIDLANGGEVIEYNDGFSLPADVKTKADDATNGIIDGSITTGA
jgi:basic membrane lipoprotein Med (substrate-binding protein (PBP1-ABC) superfamily)